MRAAAAKDTIMDSGHPHAETDSWSARTSSSINPPPEHLVRTRSYWPAAPVTGFPRRRGDVREYALDGELVLFDPVTGTLFYLNVAASMVWRLCDSRPVYEIARTLADTYDATFETVLQHVTDLVDTLLLGGLLTGDQ
jgi:hypothetical protein